MKIQNINYVQKVLFKIARKVVPVFFRSLVSRKTVLNSTKLILATICCGIVACGDAAELLDIALDPPSRKPIDKSLVAINNFFVDREFGSIPQQYADISSNLGIKRIRVLFAWTEAVQANPNSTPNYSFYDEIVRNAPPGVELLVVLSHIPNWATSPSKSLPSLRACASITPSFISVFSEPGQTTLTRIPRGARSPTVTRW